MNSLISLPGAPAWFLALLDYSLQAVALCGAVWIVTKTLGRWIPPAFRALLWFLVIARVLVPYAPPSQFSFQNLFAEAAPAAVAPAPTIAEPVLVETPSAVPSFVIPERTEVISQPLPATTPRLRVGQASAFAWVFIAATCLLALAGRCVVIHRRLTRDTTRPSLEILEALRSRYPIRVSASERIAAPALTGLLPARLIVPKNFDQFTPAQIRHILLHELAHIRQGHLLLHWLALIARALHWFNPAVHFASTRLRFECELAADAAALKNSTETERANYAQTILQILAQATAPATRLALPMAERLQLEKRLRAVTQPPRQFRLLGVAALLALSIAGLSSADRTIPEAAANIEKQSEPTQTSDSGKLQPGEVRVQIFIISALTNVMPDLLKPVFGPLNVSIEQNIATNFALADAAIQTLTNRARVTEGVDYITQPAQVITLGTQARFEFEQDFNRLGTNMPVGAESIPNLDIIPYHSPRSGLQFSLVYTINKYMGVQTNAETGQALPGFRVQQRQFQAIPISTAHSHVLYLPTSKSAAKVPVLGDIPLIGRLFRGENLRGPRASIIIIQISAASSTVKANELAELQKVRENAHRLRSAKLVEEGRALFETGDLARAQILFEQALNDNPDARQAQYYLHLIDEQKNSMTIGRSAVEIGQLANAEASLRQMFQGNPSSPAVREITRAREMAKWNYFEPMETRQYRVPPGDYDFRGRFAAVGVELRNDHNPDPQSLISSLQHSGMYYKPQSGFLYIRATPTEFQKIHKVIAEIREGSGPELTRRMADIGMPWNTSTNSQRISAGRQALYRKLETIRIDDFPLLEPTDLVKVLKELSSEIKKRDPNGKGVNLLLAPNGDKPNVDLERFQIRFDPPISDVTLRQFLDAIVMVAKPFGGPPPPSTNLRLRYSVEDYAIVFTATDEIREEPLYTRRFRVDPETFDKALMSGGFSHRAIVRGMPGPSPEYSTNNGATWQPLQQGVTLSNSFSLFPPPQPAPISPPLLNGIDLETIVTNTAAIQSRVRAFFAAAGVDFPTNAVGQQAFDGKGPAPGQLAPPTKAMFYSDRSGMLFVRATLRDLDIIEQALHALNAQTK